MKREDQPYPKSLAWVAKDAACQAPSPHSGHRFIPCKQPATTIIEELGRAWSMCTRCANSALRHRGAALVTTKDKALRGKADAGYIKMAKSITNKGARNGKG